MRNTHPTLVTLRAVAAPVELAVTANVRTAVEMVV
jgi:hypothetical protein